MNKICFFIFSMDGGGAEKVALLLANRMVAKRYEVSIFLFENKGIYLEQLDPKIKVYSSDRKYTKYLGDLGRVFSFIPFLRKIRPKKIITIGEWPNTLVPVAVKLSRIYADVILTEHNTKTFYNSDYYSISKLVKYFARQSYLKAKKIVCVSDAVKEVLINNHIPKEKLYTVHNPISIKEIELKANEYINHEWFRNKGIPILVAVGRLQNQKNYPFMLNVLKEVNKYRKVRLMILGEGDLYHNLVELSKNIGIEDSVKFIGFQPNPFKYLKQADLFIHTADFEGFGNVFVEALACGQKIITTDCGTPNEVLEYGKYGQIVKINDPEVFAQDVLNLLDKNVDKAKYIKKANDFSVENITREYLDILHL